MNNVITKIISHLSFITLTFLAITGNCFGATLIEKIEHFKKGADYQNALEQVQDRYVFERCFTRAAAFNKTTLEAIAHPLPKPNEEYPLNTMQHSYKLNDHLKKVLARCLEQNKKQE